MYERISTMLQRYERGEIRRRDLICGLAALAGLAKPAPAAEASTFKGVEVNHIALNVTNVQRSRDFYQKHLGAPIRSESARSCFLGLGNDFLALFQGTNPGMNHFCIGIENYEVGRVTAELKRQGFSPRQPAGSGRVYFDDPDGIEVQLAAAGHQP
jgi:catechol 2,3-dioxygenase-like lactoylglutathione lyase family enzyme